MKNKRLFLVFLFFLASVFLLARDGRAAAKTELIGKTTIGWFLASTEDRLMNYGPEYYGKYYQDIQVRVPAIEAAKRDLGWQPKTDMDTAIRRTIEYYVKKENFGARAALARG